MYFRDLKQSFYFSPNFGSLALETTCHRRPLLLLPLRGLLTQVQLYSKGDFTWDLAKTGKAVSENIIFENGRWKIERRMQDRVMVVGFEQASVHC